eukprot:scaffold10223_cov266-Chaetoceros_neogracile.AAC.1
MNDFDLSKSIGEDDKITPRISNRHKMDQQRRSVQSNHDEQFRNHGATSSHSMDILPSQKNHIDSGRLSMKQHAEDSHLQLQHDRDKGHESDCNMDCSSDSLGLDSSVDAGIDNGDEKSKANNPNSNVFISHVKSNGPKRSHIECDTILGQKQKQNKNSMNHEQSANSRANSKELTLDSNLIDSNGCPIVSKGLMQRARRTTADNGHVLQVLMKSCGGGERGQRESSASSATSNLTLSSSTLLGAMIPLRRCDSKESILTMSIDGDHTVDDEDRHESKNDTNLTATVASTKHNVFKEQPKQREELWKKADRQGKSTVGDKLGSKTLKASISKNEHLQKTGKTRVRTHTANKALPNRFTTSGNHSRRNHETRDDSTVKTIDSNTGSVVTHPKLPPGWKVKVSRSKNREYYIHPDFGTTWHCPVVSKHPVEIHARRVDKERISSNHVCSDKDGGGGEAFTDQDDHSGDDGQDDRFKEETQTKYSNPLKEVDTSNTSDCTNMEAAQGLILPASPCIISSMKDRDHNENVDDGQEENDNTTTEAEEIGDTVIAVHKQGTKFTIYEDAQNDIISTRDSYYHSAATAKCSKLKKNETYVSAHSEHMDTSRSIHSDASQGDTYSLPYFQEIEFSAERDTDSESEPAINTLDSKKAHVTINYSTNSGNASDQSSILNTHESPRYLDFEDEQGIGSPISRGYRDSSSLMSSPNVSQTHSINESKSSASETSHSLASNKSPWNSIGEVNKQGTSDNHSIVVRNRTTQDTLADRIKRLKHPICSLQRLEQIIKDNKKKKASQSHRNRLVPSTAHRKKKGKVQVSYGSHS